MKKLLGILVLGLLFFSNINAQERESELNNLFNHSSLLFCFIKIMLAQLTFYNYFEIKKIHFIVVTTTKIPKSFFIAFFI